MCQSLLSSPGGSKYVTATMTGSVWRQMTLDKETDLLVAADFELRGQVKEH